MNDVKSTQKAFHDGWMRTGDVLRVDAEGFFYLTDRKKELIKYKGFVFSFPLLRMQLTFLEGSKSLRLSSNRI